MNRTLKKALWIMACFCVDSILTYFLPFDFTKSGNVYIPCMGLMMFSILSMYSKDHRKLAFAIMAGAYYAILYANSLAIYILIYWFITYYAKSYHYYVSESYFGTTLFLVSTVFIQEILLYSLMSLMGLTELGIQVYLASRLGPTLLLNLGLSLPVYLIYQYFLSEGDEHEYQY